MEKRRTAIGAVLGIAIFACATPEEASVSPGELAHAPIEEVILDAREDGAVLAGWLEPAPPRSDADRVIVLRAGQIAASLDGMRVIDARFVDGGVAVLGADRVLRFHSREGMVTELDREVYGPLSVAADKVAYVRGGPPDLELARASVRTGAVEPLTQAMAPVWSPALSSDGREVIFVSGVEGAPRLFRIDAAGALHALPPIERTPSAPTAPRWSGSTLIFEDEEGVARLDLEQGVLGAQPATDCRDVRTCAAPERAPVTRGEIERDFQGAHSTREDGTLDAPVDGAPMTIVGGGAR